MWEDDLHWLPKMLEGRKFLGKFVFEGEKIMWREILLDQAGEDQWMIPAE